MTFFIKMAAFVEKKNEGIQRHIKAKPTKKEEHLLQERAPTVQNLERYVD